MLAMSGTRGSSAKPKDVSFRNTSEPDLDCTWVRIVQQRANRQQHFRNREGRAPLVLQNVQTNTAIAVDIGMINFCGEVNLPAAAS